MNTREQFGKYLLLKKLTEDPLGETFRAGLLGASGMERSVLLRVFNGQGVDGQRLWQATQGRVEIPKLLRNPNIGEGVELGEVQGLPYVAYDYISGKNMANLLEQAAKSRNYIPAEHALLITERVALALAAACESRLGGERILHGFVTPHLVMISNEGETRLLGFEVAPGLRSFAANPVIRQYFGRYMAPEALAGQPPHHADDVYSLGVMLYELLTGRPLPPPAPNGFAAVVDQGVVATEGTPIPADLANLLKRSLVPRDQRIGDVATWHKTLNKLMFEGQYNPTTFNLAFFMHNLFRQDIERESQEIEVEKTLSVPIVQKPQPQPVAPPVPPVGEGTGVHEGAGVREGTGVREVTAVREHTGTFVGEAAGQKKSKAGLIAVAAILLLAVAGGAVWYLMQQRGAPAETVAAAPPPVTAAEPENTGPSEEELNARIRELITQQATGMEDELRKQYDQQLAELQSQLDKARKEAEARRQREQELAAQQAEEEEAERQAAEAAAAQAATEEKARQEAEAKKTAAAEAPTQVAQQTPPPSAVAPPPPPPPVAPPPPARPQVRRGDLVELGPGVVPPELVRRPEPRYPEMARRLNRGGAKVLIKVLIDENGKVLRTELAGEKQGYGFDSEALSAAKNSVYKPATKEGVPVKVWHTLAVEFRR